MIGPGEIVLLIVEEAVSEEARRRRDERTEAVFPVEDFDTAEQEGSLWTAMGFGPAEDFDLERSRYHKVCIVASKASLVREWVTAFFNTRAGSLLAAGGLHVCAPPFERERAQVARAGGPPRGLPPTPPTGE